MPETEEQYAKKAEGLATTPPEIQTPAALKPFFEQRNKHRNILFWFSLGMSMLSFLLLAGLLIAQIILRVLINVNFEAISDQAIQILAVSVFGQILGVVYVIAHALWSNDEFGLMGNGKK